jgi:hypothetical protein
LNFVAKILFFYEKKLKRFRKKKIKFVLDGN